MPDGYFPTLRPGSGGLWVAKITVHGHTFRTEAQVPAAALSDLVRKLSIALDACATSIEGPRD